MQVSWNPAGLDSHQVAPDPVEDGLEDGDALELGHGIVQDEAARAADGHGNQDRGPTRVENLKQDVMFKGANKSFTDILVILS